jgi:hypothetical protein
MTLIPAEVTPEVIAAPRIEPAVELSESNAALSCGT